MGRVTPPPLPKHLVSRPRLEVCLARLIDRHQVVSVYATAGAGKTTAVLQAAPATNRPLAWFSADHTDRATGRLLTYLAAALSTQVPSVAGIATNALAARAPHVEVAGLLAEAIGDVPLLIVLDDLERMAKADAAMPVLSAFLRFLPPTARVVLVGRTELTIDLPSATDIRRIAALSDAELAFTVEEVGQALDAAGRSDIDPAAAFRVTGGWVAGVLFEAWRSDDHVPGIGGEGDPLHGYLASQIVSELGPAEREFLVVTSVLDEVTVPAAEALGLADARTRFHALRKRRLPANWDRVSRIVRYHPRFREYLLECLSRDSKRAREVRQRHGLLLLKTRNYEEAVAEFLEVGALDQALIAAEHCIESIVERGDFELAEQWLQALGPIRQGRQKLATTELMLALGKEEYGRTVDLADELEAAGEREAVARSSSRHGSIMAWGYIHAGRIHEARRVHEVTAPGSPYDAMRYLLSQMDDAAPASPPPRLLTGDAFDAMVTRVHYYRGYFPLVVGSSLSGWAGRLTGSWRCGALLAMGHTEEALQAYEATRRAPGGGDLWTSGVLSVKLMCQLGREQEARQALLEGRQRIRAGQSVMLEMISYVEEAHLELSLNHDPWSARAALTNVLDNPVGQSIAYVAEEARTWLGLAQLFQGENSDAAASLRRVVESSLRADRIFCLAAAGVYLAEAEWRLGNEEAADRAADVALVAARRQGSNHLLLEALSEFPAVLTRRLDAEPVRDSPWHEVARASMAKRAPIAAGVGASIFLSEFGKLAIMANGVEVRPRIKKSYELLAYLASRSTAEATKGELLEVLFDGRADDSASSYLRQALLKLRQVLPSGVELETRSGRVRLTGDFILASESAGFEHALAEAARMREEDRLDALLRALQIIDQGHYLPGLTTEWVEGRRGYLGGRALDARYDAAEAAFAAGDYRQADSLIEAVIKIDAFREGAWRLVMRIAHALGDDDRVMVAYRNCERVLREIGTAPSNATRQLLTSFRS